MKIIFHWNTRVLLLYEHVRDYNKGVFKTSRFKRKISPRRYPWNISFPFNKPTKFRTISYRCVFRNSYLAPFRIVFIFSNQSKFRTISSRYRNSYFVLFHLGYIFGKCYVDRTVSSRVHFRQPGFRTVSSWFQTLQSCIPQYLWRLTSVDASDSPCDNSGMYLGVMNTLVGAKCIG